MTTSINDILKPKSKKDLSKDIQKMSTHDFIYTFQYNLIAIKKMKNVKIGFKKRFLCFLISKDIDFFQILSYITVGGVACLLFMDVLFESFIKERFEKFIILFLVFLLTLNTIFSALYFLYITKKKRHH